MWLLASEKYEVTDVVLRCPRNLVHPKNLSAVCLWQCAYLTQQFPDGLSLLQEDRTITGMVETLISKPRIQARISLAVRLLHR